MGRREEEKKEEKRRRKMDFPPNRFNASSPSQSDLAW
jgi:hypothetical protein